MKPALLTRFVRSSRHVDAEPCRNCGTVYFGNYCNECGQEAYTGAPTALGFIYEFLTRNLFERGKVWRTMWNLVRHPGGLTVDFLEGRRQRFIRPVRLYLVLSVLYFLLLSLQNSNVLNYVRAPATAAAVAPAAEPLVKQVRQEPMLENFPYDKEWDKYTLWQRFKKSDQEFTALSPDKREETLYRIFLNQAPKAMFLLVPVFALLLKMLFMFRRIPYGAHLLFAFHYHCYVFFMLLLMLLPVHPIFKVVAGLSIPWYLMASMRRTYEVWWIGAVLRLLMLTVLYAIVMGITFVAVLAMGFIF